jgi:hypothetical protein
MNRKFATLIETLHPSYEHLLAMDPVTTESLPKETPISGIYLFTEHQKHLYVGRSNRLKSRVRRHGTKGSKHNVAAFAFKMAREATGNLQATYTTKGSRKDLVLQPEFAAAFADAKQRIRAMEVRFVEETDQLKQAILEMYVSFVLDTPFNDFDTH